MTQPMSAARPLTERTGGVISHAEAIAPSTSRSGRQRQIPATRRSAPFLRGPSRILGVILGTLMYSGMRAMIRVVQVSGVGVEAVMQQKSQQRPVVFACWHAHNSIGIGAYRVLFGRNARAVIMVPKSTAGKVMQRCGRLMRLRVIDLGRDSEAVQSARAVLRVIQSLKGGDDLLISVDGPTGPQRQVKPGAALIAYRAGAVIIPTTASSQPAMHLRKRWDQHLVPLPFSKVQILFGRIIDTCPTSGPRPSFKEICQRLQAALTLATEAEVR